MRGPGHNFYAIDSKQLPDLDFIDPKEFEMMLDVLAAGLDLEKPVRKCGPAAYARRHEFYQSPVYKSAQEKRLSLL